VRRGVPQLDEPNWEAYLGGDGEYGARVRPRLEGIYEAVDEADERGGVALPQGQRRRRRVGTGGVILLDGDQDGKKRFERVRERHHKSPCGELFRHVRQNYGRSSDTHPLYGKVSRAVTRVFRVDPQAKLIQLGDCCPWYSTRKLHVVICVGLRCRL
jgi:hypothetical protein